MSWLHRPESAKTDGTGKNVIAGSLSWEKSGKEGEILFIIFKNYFYSVLFVLCGPCENSITSVYIISTVRMTALFTMACLCLVSLQYQLLA